MSQTEIDLPVSDARKNQQDVAQDLAEYKFGWADTDAGYAFTSERGLTREPTLRGERVAGVGVRPTELVLGEVLSDVLLVLAGVTDRKVDLGLAHWWSPGCAFEMIACDVGSEVRTV